jgi:transcriptional regulator with XRE-family HTH domain
MSEERRYEMLAGWLREMRESRGLTQQQVADALGRPQSFVSKYECAERRLDLVELADVCDAMGCDPSEVLHRLKARPRGPRN